MNDQSLRRPGRPKGTGSQFVYMKVRERILRMEWAPGRPVDEAALVAEFGVSRTPVREALIRLAADDLVVLLPNRGASVAPIGMESVRDFFEVFDLAQRAATRWAAHRRSEADIATMSALAQDFRDAVARRDSLNESETNAAFHGAIADACGNAMLRDFYKALLSKGMRLSHLSLIEPVTGTPPEDTYFDWMRDEHALMIRHISDRNADAAERVAHDHTEKFRNNVLRYLKLSEADRTHVRLPGEEGAQAAGIPPGPGR